MSRLRGAIRRTIGEERVRRIRTRWRIVRMYKRLRPKSIQLTGSSNRIFLDLSDDRACKLIAGLGKGHQPYLRTLWHHAVQDLCPAVVIDIGVNYGEFLLAETYMPGTRIVGVEANPFLRPFLERSRAHHPNASEIELHYVLASDRDAQGVAFAADRRWSGASGALLGEDDGSKGDRLTVPATTVDALLEGSAPAQGLLLFKIDVEGWEERVMRGMVRTLDAYSDAVAIVEFNTRLLRAAGSDLGLFLDSLLDDFDVFGIDDRGAALPLATRDDTPLLTGPDIVIDLVLARGARARSWIIEALHAIDHR